MECCVYFLHEHRTDPTKPRSTHGRTHTHTERERKRNYSQIQWIIAEERLKKRAHAIKETTEILYMNISPRWCGGIVQTQLLRETL